MAQSFARGCTELTAWSALRNPHVQEYVAENFLGRLRDFNFLLYFATHRQRFGFAESEIIEMCHMVR